MTLLVGVRVLAIVVGLIWKGCHLLQRPDDRSLRAVVACFALFALATPLQLLPPDARPLGIPPSLLVATQYALLAAASFCVMTFFSTRRRVPRSRGRMRVSILVVAVVVTVGLAFLVPPDVTAREFSNRALALVYLTSELYIALALLVATRDAALLSRSSEVGRVQALGVRIAVIGLAVLAVSTLLLCVVQVNTLLGLRFAGRLGAVGGSGLLVGAPVFIVGICIPGAVMRIRSTTLWLRRCREYHRLRPLWSLLSEAFPDQVLTARRRFRPPTPTAMGRRHRRRRIEVRDGLVRMSSCVPPGLVPELPASVDDLTQEELVPLARWMRDTVPWLSDESVEAGGAVNPVLVPSSDDPEDDVKVLIKLSDALRALREPHEKVLL